MDISIKVGSLSFQSPLIISSSGLTSSISNIKEYASRGVGAVVLKSLFEEQIDIKSISMSNEQDYPEASDYIAEYVRSQEISKYLDLIKEAKSSTNINIIASINCYKGSSWVSFAKSIEEAGADAIEVNYMPLELDLFAEPNAVEEKLLNTISSLKKEVSLPIWVKLSPFHTALPALVDKLRALGVESVTLFNRSYQVDINIDREDLGSADVFSNAGEFNNTLRFTAIIGGLVKGIGVSSSSGIYTYKELVKVLLAGASTAQICTTIYKNGASQIDEILEGLKFWMGEHGYQSISEMRSKLSYGSIPSAQSFERMQFMKYSSSKK